jgi:hypothetical protein
VTTIDDPTRSARDLSPEEAPPRAAAKSTAGRRLRRLGAKTKHNLTVVSALSGNEPVSEAEIALVLAVLGDTLHDLLKADNTTCLTSPLPRAG